jgi:hypothetical protein
VIAFDRDLLTTCFLRRRADRVVDANTSPAAPTATLVDTGAALVMHVVFGAASRSSVSVTAFQSTVIQGIIRDGDADYRKYIMPLRPFDRVRGGASTARRAGDPRLVPLAWTLRDIVRGYDTGPNAGRRRI